MPEIMHLANTMDFLWNKNVRFRIVVDYIVFRNDK